MANVFKTTNRNNPCAICGDHKNRCRTKIQEFTIPCGDIEDLLFLCMEYREEISGFKYLGETENRLWGKFIDQELSSQLSTAWKGHRHESTWNKVKASPKPKIKAIRQPEKQVLSVAELDKEIRKLLGQLPLWEKHRQQLLNRGISDRLITAYQFRSIGYKQKLEETISSKLPLVSIDGMSLTNKYSGLLIPISNENAKFTGWQTRLDGLSKTKYLWPSDDDNSIHLKNGEMPINYVEPLNSIQAKTIGLVEGTGIKGLITANKYRQIVIGASGSLFCSSIKQFEKMLEFATRKTNSKRIVFYADANSVINKLVLNQYHQTCKLLINLGYEIEFAWYGQIFKSQGDIDEISHSIDFISPQEYFSMGKKILKSLNK